MKCPACGHELTAKSSGEVTLDVCEGGCGGIWFDAWELKKLDEPREAVGEDILHVRRDSAVKVDLERRRECPKDPGTVMMRHFSSVKHRVTVDECPTCAGFWVDAGELAGIRGEFETEAERWAAALDAFAETFDGQLHAEAAKTQADLERSHKVANTFRFICPSHYIPGEQSWGAF